MTVFAELQEAIRRRSQDPDFPDWLRPALQAVATSPDRYRDRQDLVALLRDQVLDFDPYAGAGCFSEAASLADIERTLTRLNH